MILKELQELPNIGLKELKPGRTYLLVIRNGEMLHTEELHSMAEELKKRLDINLAAIWLDDIDNIKLLEMNND